MLYQHYRHHTPIQIRFNDIDKLNHVNNACYLTYFETARVQYFREVFATQVNWAKEGFVIARSEIDFKMPVYLDDEIFCFTAVEKIGNKSMVIRSALVKKKAGTLQECAGGLITVVARDYEKNENMQVPALWKQLITAFEKKEL